MKIDLATLGIRNQFLDLLIIENQGDIGGRFMWRVTICLWLLLANVCYATSYKQPVRHDVFSPNGQFVLDVDPKTKTHTVYAVKDRKSPLWSFSKHVWLAPFYLSDDGTVVVHLGWEYVRVENLRSATCVDFIYQDGVIKSYTFADLCPNPARPGWFEVSQIGPFWRKWYYRAEQQENTLRLQTSDLFEYTFSMTDSSILSRELVVSNLLGKLWWALILALVIGLVGLFVWRRQSKKNIGIPANDLLDPAIGESLEDSRICVKKSPLGPQHE